MLTHTAKPSTELTNLWQRPELPHALPTGVSLHGHTSCSQESLKFVQMAMQLFPGVQPVMEFYGRLCRERHDLQLDFDSAFWCPPLRPSMAYALEADQLQQLGLHAMVSLTDHDNIDAPLLLRTLPVARGIPVSVEWSVPYSGTEFHLGIHNLPSAEGTAWMERFSRFTDAPSDDRLLAMLRELHDQPGVLIVFNHPLWDLQQVGEANHLAAVRRFVAEAGATVHALELNGLRHARENRDVQRLSRETGHLLISGGDRHGLEPNANINLTAARSFRDFVDEIRIERRSHIVFMPQYSRPWEQRILESTLAAITDYPQFTPGWQRWDERAFHRDQHGVLRPLSELWATGRAPRLLRAAIELIRLGRSQTLGRTLSLVFRGDHNFALEAEA